MHNGPIIEDKENVNPLTTAVDENFSADDIDHIFDFREMDGLRSIIDETEFVCVGASHNGPIIEDNENVNPLMTAVDENFCADDIDHILDFREMDGLRLMIDGNQHFETMIL